MDGKVLYLLYVKDNDPESHRFGKVVKMVMPGPADHSEMELASKALARELNCRVLRLLPNPYPGVTRPTIMAERSV